MALNCCESLKFTRGEILYSPRAECDPFCDITERTFKKMGCIISGQIDVLTSVDGVASKYFTDYDSRARTSFNGVELALTFYWERSFLQKNSDVVNSPTSFTQVINKSVLSDDLWAFSKQGIDLDSLEIEIYDTLAFTAIALVEGVDYEANKNYVTFLLDQTLAEDQELRMTYEFEGEQGGLILQDELNLDGSLLFVGTNVGKSSFNVLIPRAVMTLDQTLTLIDDGQFATSSKVGRIDFDTSINSYYKIYGSEAMNG